MNIDEKEFNKYFKLKKDCEIHKMNCYESENTQCNTKDQCEKLYHITKYLDLDKISDIISIDLIYKIVEKIDEIKDEIRYER
jgi:hypothetical protein